MADDINKRIAAWETLVDRYVDHRDRVASTQPALTHNDVRLALYGITGNALVTGLLNVKMTKSCLLSKSWWDEHVKGNQDIKIRQHQTDEFVTQNKIAIYILVFSFYEATIREILRAVRPGACDNGFATFRSVYDCLMTALGLQRHIPLFDFARTLRNLIHNNGTYFGKNGTSEELTLNGKAYRFEHGRKVDFVYQELLFSIYECLLGVSDDINAHPAVQALPPTPMQ